MPELMFENGLPPSDEFRRSLARTIAESNPLDDLLELAEELGDYERNYGISTENFYAKYQAGLSGDELHWMEWAGTYELFMENKRRLESALMRAAVQPESEEYETGHVSEVYGQTSEQACRAEI
ncbi:hypothetical protein QUF80_07600 [Desulfococcaceae bacterium HSG8]|nr:hypothetical protein [Desulfococcaceae bacterium HSG8]